MTRHPTKHRLIEEIRLVNQSVDRAWLASFDDSALRLYLDRLALTLAPRTAASRWVRRNGSRAAVTRKPFLG